MRDTVHLLTDEKKLSQVMGNVHMHCGTWPIGHDKVENVAKQSGSSVKGCDMMIKRSSKSLCSIRI
uniref:Uncharacterized protein n=1 Tax=Romanomermis culicivorax TaxID=13658 RepID=A0A915J7W3_ROMCU